MFDPAQYPHFVGADVFILAPTGDTWSLFSTTLAAASTIFAELLAIHPPGHITAKQREENKTIKWRFHMKPHQMGRLVDFEFVGPAAAKQALFKYNPVDDRVPTDYLHIYDNLFRCMFNIDPSMSPGDKALVDDSLDLLQAAESLRAVPCVRRDIETHLLRTGSYLWQRVIRDVEKWADIGVRLRSPVIFREAMIRIVGLWNIPSAINKTTLLHTDNGPQLYDLATAKVNRQTQRKIEIEEELRTFFPRIMLHPPSDAPGATTPGRAFYANDVYLWHALSMVRLYIVKETMAGHGYKAADGGAMFYNRIGTGGGSYCRASDLDKWHKKFDMTAKGKQRLRDSLTAVKDEMKTVVAELMVSHSNIPLAEDDYSYLKHTEFKDVELPWYTAPTFAVKRPMSQDNNDDEDSLFVSQAPGSAHSAPVAQMTSPNNATFLSSPLSSPTSSNGMYSDTIGNILANGGQSRPISQMGTEASQGSPKRRRID